MRMGETGKRDEGHERDDVVELVRRGLRGVEQIVAERDALKARLAALDGSGASAGSAVAPSGGTAAPADFDNLRRQLTSLEEQERLARLRASEAEAAARGLQVRVSELEDESNNLANLYIAGHQLYGAARFRDVVQVVSEIVINLVGVHRFALYMIDPPSQVLHPIITEGYASAPPPVALGEGVIGRTAAARTRHVGAADAPPLVVLPLLADGRLVGVLVIDQLLAQKAGLSGVDQELFTLLCDHGGAALRSAFLRERSRVGTEDTPWTVDDLRRSLAS